MHGGQAGPEGLQPPGDGEEEHPDEYPDEDHIPTWDDFAAAAVEQLGGECMVSSGRPSRLNLDINCRNELWFSQREQPGWLSSIGRACCTVAWGSTPVWPSYFSTTRSNWFLSFDN